MDRTSAQIGEPGIWIVVFGDLLAFALAFGLFAAGYRDDPAGFAAGQAALDRPLGLANTLLLLTSSLCVAQGVESARAGRARPERWLQFGMACGGGFVLLKGVEWAGKIGAGIGITTSDFFMWFFALGGLHLIHVLIGLLVLALMARLCARPADARRDALLESGAAFWHLVDVLWVFLFALFYLVRA